MPIRPENAHRYGEDWPEFSHRIRFERAGGRCECEGECGRGTHTGRCPNEHGKPAYGTGSTVCLTVAHLDHTPETRDESKVRAFCNGCHLHYDRDHHAQTAYRTRREGKAVADLFQSADAETRAEVIEECAKVCEGIHDGRTTVMNKCAAAIRALPLPESQQPRSGDLAAPAQSIDDAEFGMSEHRERGAIRVKPPRREG